MLLYSVLHFEVYDILKCKNYLIGFLDELVNFKQKKFTFQDINFFIFYSNQPIVCFLYNVYRFKESVTVSLRACCADIGSM